MSRPARARGLKRVQDCGVPARTKVAPGAGAWIETNSGFSTLFELYVAPRAGAWIETGVVPVPKRGLLMKNSFLHLLTKHSL